MVARPPCFVTGLPSTVAPVLVSAAVDAVVVWFLSSVPPPVACAVLAAAGRVGLAELVPELDTVVEVVVPRPTIGQVVTVRPAAEKDRQPNAMNSTTASRTTKSTSATIHAGSVTPAEAACAGSIIVVPRVETICLL